MATGIATLVCYAGVFGDVIGVEEMASRLGVAGQDDFYAALKELQGQGRILVKDGFAGLPDLEKKFALKSKKIETARRLISSRIVDLKKLGRNPFIKFVGISGSLAANNPTKDRDGIVDVDVFLITRNQCIWLFEIPKRIRIHFFPRQKQEPKLCLNYVMDESDMRVENRNFYTATEIRNLIPVVGMESYRKFLRANDWIDYYYPGFSGPIGPAIVPNSCNLINKSLYALVTLLYCLKYFSLEHLRKLTFTTDQSCGTNFNRVSSSHGGYQIFVHAKLNRLAAIWFADLLNAQLVDKFFPDELSTEIRRGTPASSNANYYLKLGSDYSKYGFP